MTRESDSHTGDAFPSVPERLGRYRIVARLGEGGMATAYLAFKKGIGGFEKLYVVKTLRADDAVDSDYRNMFLDEARLAAQLNHPNIVQTFDVDEEAGVPYLAMEYLDGLPLNAVVSQVGVENLPVGFHLKVVGDLLQALDYIHAAKDFNGVALEIVHRDVSPHNLFISWDGSIKLIDFGIARVTGKRVATQAGVFKGKLAYAAPEQVRGQGTDARSDLFAAGVILWEGLARRKYADRKADEFQMMRERREGLGPALKDVAPWVSGPLAELATKAMALSPGERFQTAKEFGAAIDSVAKSEGPAFSSEQVAALLNEHLGEFHNRMRLRIDERIRAVRTDSLRAAAPLELMPKGITQSGVRNSMPTAVASALVGTANDARSQFSTAKYAPIQIKMAQDDERPPSNTGNIPTAAIMDPRPDMPVAPKRINRILILGSFVAVTVAAWLFFARPIHAVNATPPASASSGVEVIPQHESILPTVRLHVEVTPRSAVIQLGDQILGTGSFTGIVPRPQEPILLRTSASGFEPREQRLLLETDSTVNVELTRLTEETNRHRQVTVRPNPSASARHGGADEIRGLR